jgi:hypothetical protein
MKINSSIIILLCVFLSACTSSTKIDKPVAVLPENEGTYVNYELGWSIDIPAGFESLSDNNRLLNEQKGREAIAKANGVNVKTDSLIHLVNFQKNQFNQFAATLQSYNQKENGSYVKSISLTNKAIFDAYVNQKIKVDTVSGKENIAGMPFHTFYIKIYGPTGDVILNQIIYSSLLQGNDFSVSINYNNEADKKAMLDAFKNSSF